MNEKLKNKRLFLFDIDGVIKLGNVLIDGSIQLYDAIKRVGGKSIFITNNSTKGERDYVQLFKNYGFDVDESNFITALSVAREYLKKHYGQDLIYVMGTQSLVKELQSCGLHITQNPDDDMSVVLVGYDSEMTYDKIVNVCRVLQTKDVVYLATNLDLKCPMPFGFVPDCGAITNFIEIATDRHPKFLGKPSPEMVLMSIEKTGFSKEQTLVVGDRLYTDIASGINAGVDTCVVFSGEVKKEDLKTSDIQPTFQFEDVMQLLKAWAQDK